MYPMNTNNAKKDQVLALRVSEDFRWRVAEVAARERRTVADFIRIAVEDRVASATESARA